MASPSPSTDPNQWFDEAEDAEDADFEPGATPKSDADQSSSSEEETDGESSDPEAELSPQEVAELVREAASLPPGKRQLPAKGKMYVLSPPGQGKKPMKPVFAGKLPEACEQLRELFFTGGRRYYRPILDGENIRFNVVSVKTIRSVLKNMLSEVPEDERDIRVFCQEHTSHEVFKHLLGIEDAAPAEQAATSSETEPAAEKSSGPVEGDKKDPPKKEKPKKEPPAKRKAGGQAAAAKKKPKVSAGQRTLDGDVVVVDSPKRSPACEAKSENSGPAVPPRASEPPRQQAPSVSAREVARIIRGKLSEIAYLLDFLEKQEDTDATARRLGL